MPTPDELYGGQEYSPLQQPARSMSGLEGGTTAYSTTGGEASPEELYSAPEVPQKAEGESFAEAALAEAPQTIGGVAGGIAGAKIGAGIGALGGPMGVAAGAVLGGAIGAAMGGAGGKGYQLAYKSITGAEDAPKDSYDAAVKMAMAGGEEAAWDLGGQIGARALGKAVHMVRPKAVDDIEKLAVKLEKHGGIMTAAQRTDSWLVHQLDSLTRGSITGSGRMKAIDTLNDIALGNMENELRQKIAKNVTENLSDRELGQLFLNTVNDGRAAHKALVNELYSGFDEMVPTKNVQKVVTRKIPTGRRDPATGREIISEAQETVQESIGPVKTGQLKASLQPVKDQLERINWAGESADSKKLLDTMLNQPDNLSFSDAQALRSNLLDAQRNLEGTVGKSKITNKVNTVVDELTKAMDDAAKMQGPQVQARYAAIKKYASRGYETFGDKFIADMVVAGKTNPERIGEHIFRKGNVEEIKKVKKALRYAAVYGKDKGVSYDKVWTKMQSGYLEDVLTRSSRAGDIAAGVTAEGAASQLEISGKKLLTEFTDQKKARTLAEVFDKEQRDAILEFAKVAERVQKPSQGGLGMLMQLTQGGAIVGAATGNIDPQEAGVVFLSPYVIARMMTNPKGARLLATALKTPGTDKAAGGVIGQLTSYAYDIQQRMAGNRE